MPTKEIGLFDEIVYRGPRLTIRYRTHIRQWRQVAYGPEIRGHLRAIAKEALPYAKSISPRSRRAKNRDGTPKKHYADYFDIKEGTWAPRFKPLLKRPTVMLRNTSPQAAAVEWGNARMRKPSRVLQRTLAHIEATAAARGGLR